jgi:hypothetical protein
MSRTNEAAGLVQPRDTEHWDIRSDRLNREVFLRVALANAGTSVEKLKTLQAGLDKAHTEATPWIACTPARRCSHGNVSDSNRPGRADL